MLYDLTRQPGWKPPHCPNPNCRHHKKFTGKQPYIWKGYYRRKSDGFRVRRLKCGTCHRNFSTQTFSTSYWLQRPELLPSIFGLVVSCSGNRQMARFLKCSPETVCRHVARLARHAMLWHWMHWQQEPPEGPIAVDGLRSFEYSQYHPIEHHVVVEADTSFIAYHTDSELRRMGRMTPPQKRRREELEKRLGKPAPQSVRDDVAELLQVTLARAAAAVLDTDEHQAYPRSIRAVDCEITHRTISSRAYRGFRNPLFEINLFDLLIRHTQANHKRETIAFSKRRQASAERLCILQLYRNYVNSRREKKKGPTPAMLK